VVEPDSSDIEFEPVDDRFALEPEELRGDVSSIRRARERASGRIYGIQRPLPGLDSSESADAFRALRDTGSQLRHPRVLDLYEVARDAESAYGIVEWPEGGNLAERLARLGPLDDAGLFEVAIGAAEALAYAAKRRIHHGAIIPENLVVTERGEVKVAGFGLDRLRARTERGSPESLDVVQLCRSLWRLATALERIERDRLDSLPPWLREVISRGLDSDPARRFQAADEFLAELRRAEQLRHSVLSEASIEFGGPTPAPSSSIRAPRGASAISGSRARSGGSGRKPEDEFPWRPLAEQYAIEGSPKQGGMGAVHRAKERATGRVVAIKRMRSNLLLDDDAWRRFHREAASIARLNHPNVLQLLQVARDEAGDYLVLEWAEGGSLQERVQREGPLDPRALLELARKVGAALVYAHSKGSIHRDVKPHNVLLGESGEPKLADFGLARTHGDETLTVTGGGAGSPHYIAPEQAVDARQADARSDLYSFAATLYFAATGKKPITQDPLLLPRAFRLPLMTALSESPAKRQRDVTAFLVDLEEAQRRESRRKPLAAAAVGIILAATGLASFLLLRGGEEREREGGSERELVATTPANDDAPLAGSRDAPPNQNAKGDEPPIAKRDEPPIANRDEPMIATMPPREPEPVPQREASPSPPAPVVPETAPPTPVVAPPSGEPEPPPVLPVELEPREASPPPVVIEPVPEPVTTGIPVSPPIEKAPEAPPPSEPESPPPTLEVPEVPEVDDGPDVVEVVEVVDPADPWSVARAAIRAEPAYAGLTLGPQSGLAPLRRDPQSGLYEFLVIGSGTPPVFMPGEPYVLGPETGIVLVLIPGGDTVIGAVRTKSGYRNEAPPRHLDPDAEDRRETPERAVTLAPYFLAKHELTWEQWLRLAGAADPRPDGSRPPREPLTGAPFAQAIELLAPFGLALPTEAQWEHAARGGTVTPYWCGDLDAARAYCHLRFDGAVDGRPQDSPMPVGALPANHFGLHEILGNVAEWCQDAYQPGWNGAKLRAGDGLREAGETGYRVLRGGSFKDAAKRFGRSASRDFAARGDPATKNSAIGLRPARALEP
jgi:serine/threonine protein kinase/formylglycine-generating enzyme required for sulfatase activity